MRPNVMESCFAAGSSSRVALLLTSLGKAGAINLERAVIDSASVRAVFGGRTPAPTRPIVRKKAANAMC